MATTVRFDTHRRIVIFDLDGVLFHSPSQETIHDRDFWEEYWSMPSRQEPNREMISLLHTLPQTGIWQSIILTARPRTYRPQTVEALRRSGVDVTYDHDVIRPLLLPVLFMWSGDDAFGNGNWKKRVIESWQENGADVAWVIEDFKPNADAIRSLCPVLLYERQK